jgi:predicted enzyme related to lactoylglutathione lyase
MGVPHGFIAGDKGEAIGAVIAGPTAEGSEANAGAAGPILYLNAGGDLAGMLDRIPQAGGKVLAPATPIGPQGQIAIFVDSEGNRLGLHQPPM